MNVIDSNRPGDVILTFDILGANVLCIASVSGVKDYDYPSPQDIIPEENEAAEPVLESSATESSATESGAAESSAAESGAADSIDDQIMGSIRYVSCSVAGSDLVEQPKDNETEGNSFHLFHPFIKFIKFIKFIWFILLLSSLFLLFIIIIDFIDLIFILKKLIKLIKMLKNH